MRHSSIQLKAKLKSGATALGTWCEINAASSINVLAKAGLDFVLIDMEHGAASLTDVQHMIFAAQADGCAPIVRVPNHDESTILRVLDMEPAGIIVPHVDTLVQLDSIAASSYFAPLGARGLNPFIRAGNYGDMADGHAHNQNDQTLLCIIIESKAGLENLDAIVQSKAVDVVYLGAYDLSVALGVPGEVTHPDVKAAIETAAATIRANGKIAGAMIHQEADAAYYKQHGIQFLAYRAETDILRRGVKSMLDAVNSLGS